MFLRCKTRKKDGKTHRYWSVVENRRVRGGRVVQRHVLYLGELNDAQHAGWVRAIDAIEDTGGRRAPVAHQLALFPDDHEQVPDLTCEVVRIRLDQLTLRRPRQWGACWLALWLWDYLALDDFWKPRLEPSRKGTRWLHVLKTLTCYRLLDPGSEWRLHREWFEQSAMGDLLGEDFSIAAKNTLYRCLDKLLKHRDALFVFLRERWQDLFGAEYDVLLYDLTSTYFECDPPESGKRRFGYSRDKRPDCVQVVIALIVTPQGFPLAYEVYPGNTQDRSTLREFLNRIEKQYGRHRRTWLMDRGIPTEETLEEMRARDVGYLVGTPKGRLSKLEQDLLSRPWEKARESVKVKLLERDGELYIYVQSAERVAKERSMRQRRLRKLWARLKELRAMKQTRDQLLMRLGAAKKQAGRAWGLVTVHVPAVGQEVTSETFTFELNRQRLRETIRREGRYLLRSNQIAESGAALWEKYLLLVQVEQAFKDLKSDLSIRPVYHQIDKRVEAHIFVCFLAYCLFVTLKNFTAPLAGGLTPRSILEKFKHIQMLDVHLPTTDGRTIVLSRHTEPDNDLRLLLERLDLRLPGQPPPKVYGPSGEESG
jgi:transposase